MMMLVAAKFCIGIFITLALVALGMLVAVLRGRTSASTSKSTSKNTSQRPACGRVVCAWCVPMRDLGPAPGIAAGLTTHAICEGCLAHELEVLAKLSPKKT